MDSAPINQRSLNTQAANVPDHLSSVYIRSSWGKAHRQQIFQNIRWLHLYAAPVRLKIACLLHLCLENGPELQIVKGVS